MMLRKAMLAALFFGAATNCSPANNRPSKEDDEQWISVHGNDPKALDTRFGSSAQAACSVGADAYLRSIARYDFAWDKDAEGWNGVKFNKISLNSTGLGMLTLLSDRAKLSNAFGAFEHIDIYCLYNAATGEAVRFETHDPYLDTLDAADSEDNHAAADNHAAPPLVIYNATNDSEPAETNSEASADFRENSLNPNSQSALEREVQ